MKSYLEVTWLLNGSIFLCVWSVTSLLHGKTQNMTRSVCCAILCSFVCWCVRDMAYGSFLVEFFFGFLIFGHYLFANLQSVLMSCVWVNLLGRINGFASQKGLLYIDVQNLSWIFILCGAFFVMACTEHYLPKMKKKSELYVPVQVQTRHNTLNLVGYYDTGNCVTIDHLPVVFVGCRLVCDRWIEVSSITGTSHFEAVEASLKMDGKLFDVIVAYAPDLQVECLLHGMLK